MANSNGLTFITSNPATEAFNEGQRAAMQREAQEIAMQGQQLQNAEQLATAPSRLRQVKANSDLAVTNADVAGRTADYKVQTQEAGARSAGANADVAQGTVGSRIATSGNQARLTGANADVAVGTVQPRIDSAAAAARAAGANADVNVGTVQPRIDTVVSQSRLAGVNADVGERTADAKVQTAQAGARSASANAIKAEMEGFYKSLEFLNAGDEASAQYVAQQYGSQIPPQVVQDAGLRKEITDAANYAKTTYPNRPKDQQLYIQGFIKTRLAQKASAQSQGEQAGYDPTAVYNVPNAPTPPEIATTSQQHAPADIQTAQWLVANGVANNAAEAWALVKQARANPQTIYASVFNNAVRASFGDTAKAKKTADDFMKFLGQVSTTPAAAPAPAAPGAAGGM